MSDKKTENLKIFEPGYQHTFWSSLDPDLRVFLDEFEMKETWTYDYNELPGLFIEIANTLPKISTMNIDDNSRKILDELYPLLASMPLRLCVSAIAWLDRNIKNESEHGWGAIIFLEASKIAKQTENTTKVLSSKMVYERIRIILMTRLATRIFTNIKF
jgi:hypothetical protein